AATPAFAPTQILGREVLQTALVRKLQSTLQGNGAFAALVGPTGAGKSALAEWLAEEAAARGVAVLRGRGRPSERVAYNALDGAIDDLAAILTSGPLAGVATVASVAIASTIFP